MAVNPSAKRSNRNRLVPSFPAPPASRAHPLSATPPSQPASTARTARVYGASASAGRSGAELPVPIGGKCENKSTQIEGSSTPFSSTGVSAAHTNGHTAAIESHTATAAADDDSRSPPPLPPSPSLALSLRAPPLSLAVAEFPPVRPERLISRPRMRRSRLRKYLRRKLT